MPSFGIAGYSVFSGFLLHNSHNSHSFDGFRRARALCSGGPASTATPFASSSGAAS
ncbi:hypothetical protein AGMMS50268_18630 [Spirochaetia bacterium]|nr:hypothetical protein AGMMS50268_18630 [Spirochaetia bacterium]